MNKTLITIYVGSLVTYAAVSVLEYLFTPTTAVENYHNLLTSVKFLSGYLFLGSVYCLCASVFVQLLKREADERNEN